MATNALPLLLGAAAVFFLMAKKDDDPAVDSDGEGNGVGTGGGDGAVGIIAGALVGPDSWKFCPVSGTGSQSAINTSGACAVFWSPEIRQKLEERLALAYSALDAEDKAAVCAPVNPDPPARIAFISDITREVWPELVRGDVVFPPKAGTLSGRDFPKYAYERVRGLFFTNHCGFSN